MIPQSGIDVIKVILAPYIFNRYFFYGKKSLGKYNNLTVHRRGQFYTLEIHIEYMDLTKDCHLIIAEAIYDMWMKDNDFYECCKSFTQFIYSNLEWFVLGVNCI